LDQFGFVFWIREFDIVQSQKGAKSEISVEAGIAVWQSVPAAERLLAEAFEVVVVDGGRIVEPIQWLWACV